MQSVLDLRKSVDEIKGKYDALGKDPEVTKALEALSASSKSKHKLGPSKALTEAIKLLERAERTVQSDSIPIHKENGVFHVSTMLMNGNKKVPAKMVFDTGAGLTTISSKLADSLGLKAKPTDEPITMKIADGSEIKGRKLVVPFVRVGKFTIANVECAVMPAEKLDVDPLLGQTFFKHFKVEFSRRGGKAQPQEAGHRRGRARAEPRPRTAKPGQGQLPRRPPRPGGPGASRRPHRRPSERPEDGKVAARSGHPRRRTEPIRRAERRARGDFVPRPRWDAGVTAPAVS